MLLDDYPCLALNADLLPLSYAPVSALRWQTAVHMMVADRVSVVEGYDRVIHSPSLKIRLPAVVKLREMHNQYRKSAYTRMNVLVRDGSACVYCGAKLMLDELSIDHVVPRSRGGKTRFTNCVSSCEKCNWLKRDRLPEEIGLVNPEPHAPTIAELNAKSRRLRATHLERLSLARPEWRAYLL